MAMEDAQEAEQPIIIETEIVLEAQYAMLSKASN
jgi:hypothetical protein